MLWETDVTLKYVPSNLVTLSKIFICFMKVKMNLKDIIRLYNIEDFIKLLKHRFTIGTFDTLYIATLNCHWDSLKDERSWLRIFGDPRESSTNFSYLFLFVQLI